MVGCAWDEVRFREGDSYRADFFGGVYFICVFSPTTGRSSCVPRRGVIHFTEDAEYISKDLLDESPNRIPLHFREQPLPSCPIEPFIRILQDEGIYERNPEPDQDDSSQPIQNNSKGKGKDDPKDKSNPLPDESISPEQQVRQLARLPVDLPSLEILNLMLTSGTLAQLVPDPVSVIRDYIQHGLRTVERMGQDDGAEPDTLDFAAPETSGDDRKYPDERGREAQMRTVRLLVLFVRNLILRHSVDPQKLFFEIQEICVRYIWVREARELRNFLQEGVEKTDG